MCGRLVCLLLRDDAINSCTYSKVGSTPIEYVVPSYIANNCKLLPSYNVCPSKNVPVMIGKGHYFLSTFRDLSEFVIVPMQWGGVVQDPRYKSHNARIETILQSGVYESQMTLGHRCVVLCNGFYEWQKAGRNKQPYYIYQEPVNFFESDDKHWKDNNLMKLAGIFRYSPQPGGGMSVFCSIITKEADQNMSWLHDRMPIALRSYYDVNRWINSFEYPDVDEACKFLTEYPQDENSFSYHPVSKEYINTRHDSSKCIERINLKRQGTLLDFVNKKGPAAKK